MVVSSALNVHVMHCGQFQVDIVYKIYHNEEPYANPIKKAACKAAFYYHRTLKLRR